MKYVTDTKGRLFI